MTKINGNIGEIRYEGEPITLRPGSRREVIRVQHCGDRPIQVGCHFHFFEVNKALQFDREKAFGMHLDILSGTAIRFEPGEEKTVQLVDFGGKKNIFGFNGLTMGSMEDQSIRENAFKTAVEKGYMKK
ncbi:urease subunit beta [Peribacillus huizhouensis]|uniref:Urease beta subunit n=1 Tax=Peribacillus huizhouensis TaxID=1501239 RepID=A0ABR6CKH8_9BACI|nr:urease subunit beta [Peribacillus huizhouensis]MBA9025567.1 urease beta subunit [Peribacillus huizhouensis]